MRAPFFPLSCFLVLFSSPHYRFSHIYIYFIIKRTSQYFASSARLDVLGTVASLVTVQCSYLVR